MKCDIELLDIQFAVELTAFDEALINNEILQPGTIVRESRKFSFLLQDRDVTSLIDAKTVAWTGKEGMTNAIMSTTQKEYAENKLTVVVVRPTSLADWKVKLHRAPSALRNDPEFIKR